jgi:predicted secreted protein
MPRITIQATVPAGKKTGETFTAKMPSGTDVQVTVPKNAPPGAKLEITVEETVKVTPDKDLELVEFKKPLPILQQRKEEDLQRRESAKDLDGTIL